MSSEVAENDVEAPVLHLLTLPEVFVYKIPPMQGSSGHRASNWNLEKPAMVGQLRLASKGDKVYVQILQNPENSSQLPKLFASCPIKLDPDTTKPNSKLDFFLQNVTDSSRYFVLRVEDEVSKRHAYIGIGFQERQSAFDMRAAIDDEVKRISRGESNFDEEEGEDESSGPVVPKVDRSLKEGETIKVNINIGGKSSSKKKKKNTSVTSATAGLEGLKLSAPPSVGIAPPPLKGPPGLKPPPAPPATTSSADQSFIASNTTSAEVDAQDDFEITSSLPANPIPTPGVPSSAASVSSTKTNVSSHVGNLSDEDPFGFLSSNMSTTATVGSSSTTSETFPMDDPFSSFNSFSSANSATMLEVPVEDAPVLENDDDFGDFQS